MQAFEDAITATSTAWAPWYVIPADHKSVMRAIVARILVETIQGLGLSWPEVSDRDRKRTPRRASGSRPRAMMQANAADPDEVARDLRPS